MGTYLPKPITTKESSDSEGFLVKYGASSVQGWRESQEDAHNTILDFDKNSSLFAVYDGHGGNEVAEFCSKYLPAFIKQEENYLKGDYEQGMKDAFVRFDAALLRPVVTPILRQLKKTPAGHHSDPPKDVDVSSSRSSPDETAKQIIRVNGNVGEGEMKAQNENTVVSINLEPAITSGTTALVAMLVDKELYVANAGDSRCVLCREGQAIEMSIDHFPLDEGEIERVKKAQGHVTYPDGRINGGLNISRTIGDHHYKQVKELPPTEQMVIALPDVRRHTVDPSKDEFMVLACDGIWNVMDSQGVVDFVRDKLKTFTGKLSQICEELFDQCLAPTCSEMSDGIGCDNMSCIIVQFKPNLSSRLQGEGTSAKQVIELENSPAQDTHVNWLHSNSSDFRKFTNNGNKILNPLDLFYQQPRVACR